MGTGGRTTGSARLAAKLGESASGNELLLEDPFFQVVLRVEQELEGEPPILPDLHR